MKNIKFLILILTVAIISVSCETYDDYDSSRDTVVGFTLPAKNISGIPEGGTKTITVDVFASDVSSAARTFKIVAVPVSDPETNIPTDASNYNFDSTVTIPANERVGLVSLTGVDVSLTGDRTYFQIVIQGGDDVVTGGPLLVGLKN